MEWAEEMEPSARKLGLQPSGRGPSPDDFERAFAIHVSAEPRAMTLSRPTHVLVSGPAPGFVAKESASRDLAWQGVRRGGALVGYGPSIRYFVPGAAEVTAQDPHKARSPATSQIEEPQRFEP